MNKQIEFNRPKKYTIIEQLGAGACGVTVRLRDSDMDVEFVAKKYSPYFEESEDTAFHSELLNRFRDEARMLFRLNHPNVVRVFNFFDYPERKTAYILMESIRGTEILDYIQSNPFLLDRVFEGVIDGFAHLQSKGVVHRDIRPANILIDSDGVAKIIDFGFGKVDVPEDISVGVKSISLNWWCETPPEFRSDIYDFQTEVYFVGKLFEKALADVGLVEFKYKTLVARMCEPDRDYRIKRFQDIQSEIRVGKFDELSFSDAEISTYRIFADALTDVVSSIQSDARFELDPDKIVVGLEALYRKAMLEEFLPGTNKLAQIFIKGAFRYWRDRPVSVSAIHKFMVLFRGLSEDKKMIVVENLTARLEAGDRTDPPNGYGGNMDDEIPF